MRRVLALSALLLAAGCVAKAPPAHDLADSKWRFVTIDGEAPADPAKATLSFAEGDLGANVGCNGMGGEWRVEANRLIAGPLVATQMYCDGPVWDQEQAVGALLVAAPVIELGGEELTLRSSGHEARLERVSPANAD